MKRTVIAFVMMLAVAGTASAQNAKANAERFQRSFTKSFPGASVNVWDTQEEFVVARFYLNEIKYDALFTNDANLYAVTKYTTIDQLPAKVSEAIQKKYGANELAGAMEVAKMNDRPYYVTKVHYKKSVHTIRVTSNGKIEVIKKEAA